MDAIADQVRGLSKGANVVKIILLVTNVFVMLCALLLIGVGGAAAGHAFNQLTSTSLAGGIIAIGVLMLIISFVGCFGAWKENRKLLIAFFAMVLFFVIVQLAVGITAYVHRDELPQVADAAWTVLYNEPGRASLNDIQDFWKCCGFQDTADRAVPPFGTEDTCAATWFPGQGVCNSGIFSFISNLYNVDNDLGITQASALQTLEQCCGWSSTAVSLPWGVVNATDSTSCISQNPTFRPCFEVIGDRWAASKNASTVQGDEYIVGYQLEYHCCGWLDFSTQVPPYSNNTCVIVKGYEDSCEPVLTESIMRALGAVGGISIAVAFLELFVLGITIYLIRAVPKNGKSSNDIEVEHTEMVDEE